MVTTFNHKVFCRQALIGGNYALLNTTTFIPNPDYYRLDSISQSLIININSVQMYRFWEFFLPFTSCLLSLISALLWHRLMGPGVLHTTHNGSPYLRAYAHCSKQKVRLTIQSINLLLYLMSPCTTYMSSIMFDRMELLYCSLTYQTQHPSMSQLSVTWTCIHLKSVDL